MAFLIVALAVLVAGLEFTGTNLWLSRLLISDVTNWWYFRYDPMLEAFDRIAPLSGLLLAALAFIGGYRTSRETGNPIAFRNGLFLLLVLAIGPGLAVNAFKLCWARPRPADVTVFGGVYPYLKFWTMGFDPDNCRSFPSGHASIGFYLLAPAFLCFRDSIKLRQSLKLGSLAAFVIGLSRVLQGSHFATDVFCSGIIVLTTCILVHSIVFNPKFLRRLEESGIETSELGRGWNVNWPAMTGVNR